MLLFLLLFYYILTLDRQCCLCSMRAVYSDHTANETELVYFGLHQQKHQVCFVNQCSYFKCGCMMSMLI